MVPFEEVIQGLNRYINSNEFYSNMNDLQEIAARIAVGRVLTNHERIKTALMNNGIIRTFGFMDDEGNVDLETLMKEIKREVEKKGKMCIEIPMIGKFTFHAEDMDNIYREITGRNII